MNSINKQRLYLSILFFLSGFCFATWASRIPTIKSLFNLNDAQLGTVLLSMPLSSLMGLPLSGWLVSKYDSRVPLTIAFSIVALSILSIGFSNEMIFLILSICLFAFSTRILNISLNTQAINLQKKFDKKINGSFHGLWSSGGIAGVGFSTFLVKYNVPMKTHFIIVFLIAVVVIASSFNALLTNDKATSGNKLRMGKPDPFTFFLGLLVFFACICEGGMFDWSGIFFKEVVKEDLFTLGYLLFMICMSVSRFASDKLVEAIGMQKVYFSSSILIVSGILLAISFPGFYTSLAGFCMVGFGTAPVIPMTYALAGTSKKFSSGMAISILATYGIAGMFIGPPLIGYLSQLFQLRTAFITFAISGLAIIPVSILFFKYEYKNIE